MRKLDFSKVKDRKYNIYTFFPSANVFNGFQTKSALNEYSQVYSNYCLITISSTKCKNWCKYGTKIYIWDSSNDNNNYDSTMNIEIPTDGNFTLTIELYESCGGYYNHGGYKRAQWIHQQNYIPTSIISISNWKFNGVHYC